MRCPNDSSDLTVADRHGVNVLLCPVCRGIWLSDDDLDAIVGRVIADTSVVDLDDGLDANRKPRRRDKYSDEFDIVDRPRKSRNRRHSRDVAEEYADY
jgi:Zn-finger nucleic acid-binding protein